MKRTPLRRAGKKTLEWAKVRKELKIEFEASGVTTCQFRLEDCWNDNGLSFAHAVKRSRLKADSKPGEPTHIKTVALACPTCHTRIEMMKPSEMEAIVTTAYHSRKQK